MGKTTATTLLGATLLLAACSTEPEPDGKSLFTANCVSCHGTDARGGGPLAAGLDTKPADLTRIAARRGGAFPMVEVLSIIDGYKSDTTGPAVMPEFGAMLENGPRVLYDSGDGIPTPTPAGLVALAEYLRSIQQ